MRKPDSESVPNIGSGSSEADDSPDKKTSWRDRAYCKDKDIDQMFGDSVEIGKKAVERQQRIASVALCGECEVELDCLESAKKEERLGEDPQEVGVYGLRGGMTESERRRYYRRMRRANSRNKRRSVA